MSVSIHHWGVFCSGVEGKEMKGGYSRIHSNAGISDNYSYYEPSQVEVGSLLKPMSEIKKKELEGFSGNFASREVNRKNKTPITPFFAHDQFWKPQLAHALKTSVSAMRTKDTQHPYSSGL